MPVGSGGAWPDNEATRRAKLAALTASGRAATHGHTEQPGPQDSTCGARDTSGATSNTTTGATPTRPSMQKTDIHNRMSACGGARGIRTPDLLIANETRYQLRHSPKDSNSLAPWRSATQADHDHVRDTTDRKKRSDSPVYATPLPNTTPRRYPTLRNAHEAR